MTSPEPRLQPCCQAMPPEHMEFCRLVGQVKDRNGSRYVSVLGQRRDHPVGCQRCQTSTWAIDALCDRCALDERARALTHLEPQARQALL